MPRPEDEKIWAGPGQRTPPVIPFGTGVNFLGAMANMQGWPKHHPMATDDEGSFSLQSMPRSDLVELLNAVAARRGKDISQNSIIDSIIELLVGSWPKEKEAYRKMYPYGDEPVGKPGR